VVVAGMDRATGTWHDLTHPHQAFSSPAAPLRTWRSTAATAVPVPDPRHSPHSPASSLHWLSP
jgi:hypothetical protein